MLITAIQVKKVDSGTRLIGIANLTLDNMIAIHDIKIIRNVEGYFLAMPSKKLGDNVFKDIVHPISSAVRLTLERLIFAAMDRLASTSNAFLSAVLDPLYDKDFFSLEFSDYSIVNENSHPPLRLPQKEEQKPQEPKTSLDQDVLKWLEN